MEQFTITFDHELAEMQEKNRGLIASWQALGNGPRHHYYGRKGNCCLEYRPWRLFRESRWTTPAAILLNSDEFWMEAHLFRPLFKALVYAENRFASRFCPLRSNEERLTGHLISEIGSALAVVTPAIADIAQRAYGIPVEFDFTYSDLSTGGREKETGADFGVALFVNLPGMREPLIRLAAFQAKKMAKNKAEIDVDQLNAFDGWSEGKGLYTFYDIDRDRGMAPIVARVKRLKEDDTDQMTGQAANELKGKGRRRRIDAVEASFCTLSEYLVFDMILNEEGVPADDLRHAAKLMRIGMSKNSIDDPVKRALIISIGSTAQQNIESLHALLQDDQ